MSILNYKVLTCSSSGAMHTVYLQGSAGAMAETAQTVNWSFSPITVQEMACCEDSVALVQHESNP